MSLFSTISVRRSGKEPFVRNTYLSQRQSPVPTPFISPGDGIQYTKTPSCSSITPALGIRAGLPGNWLVVDEHKVWDYPWRSGDYRKGVEGLRGVWQCFSTSLLPQSTKRPCPTCSFNLQPHKYACVPSHLPFIYSSIGRGNKSHLVDLCSPCGAMQFPPTLLTQNQEFTFCISCTNSLIKSVTSVTFKLKLRQIMS